MKAYAYLAAFVALLGALWGVYHMGGAECREASANAAREHLEAQNSLLSQLDDAKRNREVVYRDKTRVIRESADSCADIPIAPAIRMQLSSGHRK